MAYIPSRDLAPRVLAGDTRAIARLLSRAESGVAEARETLDAMFSRAGRAHVVGITGVPGSGKSTLVATLAAAVRASGRTVAIVAIDPSSPYSGGAILGDRIRMGALGGDPGVYVRSMATRGALGGLAAGTLEVVDVLDAAGFDMVMIETVGVGQDEVEVARAAHTTVVISTPGLGDDIQAIKAGILEIADIHVVSKCDKPDANRTIVDLKTMLALGLAKAKVGSETTFPDAAKVVAKIGSETTFPDALPTAATMERGKVVSDPAFAWRPPILATSALREQGVFELRDAIDAHRAALERTGEIERRRASIAERRLLAAGEAILREQFARNRNGKIDGLLERLRARTLSPRAAARGLLRELRFGGDE